MRRVSSRITINRNRVNRLNQAAITALELTVDALHTEIEQAQVMPRDTGALQNENTFVDKSKSQQGKVSIISSTLYARRLYFHPEYNFKKDENPNAKGKWLEDWLPGGTHEDFCEKAFKRLYRRLGGL